MNTAPARKSNATSCVVLTDCENAPRGVVREGFSLLEVILALGLLSMSLALIMEVNRTALRSAAAARDLTKARLLCESKMAEVVAGIMPLETVDEISFADEEYVSMSSDELGSLDDFETNASLLDTELWYYSIETLLLDENGLTEVRVSVWRDTEGRVEPKPFTLVRWVVDEEVVAMLNESLDAEASASEGGI